jgi:hypothetical protein
LLLQMMLLSHIHCVPGFLLYRFLILLVSCCSCAGDSGSDQSDPHECLPKRVSELQGEEGEGVLPWRTQMDPSLALSATPSGTESAGDGARNSVGDLGPSEGSNRNIARAVQGPPHASSSTSQGAVRSSVEAPTDGEGVDEFRLEREEAMGTGAGMGMALRLSLDGIDGGVLGATGMDSGNPTSAEGQESAVQERVGQPNMCAADDIALNEMDLQIASIRSDGSQMLGMPPASGVSGVWDIGPDGGDSSRPPCDTCSTAHQPSGSNLTSSAAVAEAEAGFIHTDVHAAHDSRGVVQFDVAAHPLRGTIDVSGNGSGVASTRAEVQERSAQNGDWKTQADVELAQLSELVQNVAVRVQTLMRQRHAFSHYRK